MADKKMKKYSKKLLVPLIFGAIAAITLTPLWYIGRLGDNFRVVTSGKCYRSGQMNYKDLCETISRYKIKTIINLRGANKGPWYNEELKAADNYGVEHVDIKLNAKKLPSPMKLSNLLKILHNSPYPILIHCRAGSDRSGLACSIYRNVIEDVPLDIAVKEQLTWRYGHISIGPAHAMDEFFDLYQQTNKGKGLARWITEDYPSLYAGRK
jgi:protein tyrosine/serine phosphatase